MGWEPLSVKREILVLVCMSDVEPERVNWELKSGEFEVPLDNFASRESLLPFRVVKTQGK